jgi:hypothetical protein
MRSLNIKNKFKKGFSLNLILLFGIISVFIGSNIYFAIYSAIVSDKLILIEKTENELLTTNRSLSSNLVKYSSLTSLSEKTQSLGFNKPSNIMYLKEEETVASIR